MNTPGEEACSQHSSGPGRTHTAWAGGSELLGREREALGRRLHAGTFWARSQQSIDQKTRFQPWTSASRQLDPDRQEGVKCPHLCPQRHSLEHQNLAGRLEHACWFVPTQSNHFWPPAPGSLRVTLFPGPDHRPGSRSDAHHCRQGRARASKTAFSSFPGKVEGHPLMRRP